MSEQSNSLGRYRRLIDIQQRDQRTVVAWMEDDFHHFGIALIHNNETVRDLHAESPRHPWSTCPGAFGPLKDLIGKPLISRASQIGTLIEMREQCTHLFDLAGLALAHAAQRREHRRYEVIASERDVMEWDESGRRPLRFGPGTVVLRHNDVEVMRWEVDDQTIVAPAMCAGRSLQRGFREWTEAMPEEEAEYATVLRRAVMVSLGRKVSLSHMNTAEELGHSGLCYTYQPRRARFALRMEDSIRDFSKGSQGMLAAVKRTPGIT